MNTNFTADLDSYKLRDKICEVLDPLIPNSSACVLIDFPHHSNVGDSAIWLGEIAYLNRRKCHISYMCDYNNYNPRVLEKLIGNNTIIFHGGGNFGDLWPIHQKLRETIIKDFPKNRIIIFPQSIYFSNIEPLEESKQAFSTHKDFHLVVRDSVSFEFAKKHYKNPVYLCPDMAMMLDIKPLKNRSKSTNLVILSRNDREKQSDLNEVDFLKNNYHCTDWVEEPKPKYQWLYEWSHLRLGWDSKVPKIILVTLSTFAANQMAKERLERGLNTLGQGNVVITDRLHAVILSLLGKTPVYFVDNSYRKLSNFIDTWLINVDNIQSFPSFKEAILHFQKKFEY